MSKPTSNLPTDELPDDLPSTLLEAMPIPVLVVNRDRRVLWVNPAAEEQMGLLAEAAYYRRGGEALQCIHAGEHPDGCGYGGACVDCPVRLSVAEAVDGGKVYRRKVTMQLKEEVGMRDVHLMITAAPLPDSKGLAMLMIENVSHLINLASLVPVCMCCGQVRVEGGADWQPIQDYLREHIDIDFSHGLCPDCSEKIYPRARTRRDQFIRQGN
ncbi:MAG: PAS domain-containing protein [Phycisphaerae bacterium]